MQFRQLDLIERNHETAVIEDAFRCVCDLSGQFLLIEGPSGIGKTALAKALAESAGKRGMRVAWARGNALEATFPYGVVRQLFEPLLFKVSTEHKAQLFAGAARLAAPLFDYSEGNLSGLHSVQGQQMLHGLYWICVNLSQERPLVIVVDDIRWIDAPSLRFLHYLAGRLDDRAILIAVTAGPLGNGPAAGPASAIGHLHVTTVLRLAPLTHDATRKLLVNAIGAEPEKQLVADCHRSTGGNPFLLNELVAELVTTDAKGGRLDPAAFSRVAPRVVYRTVLRWLGRLSPAGVALAEAASVLSDPLDQWQAAAMVGLDETEAAAAITALVEVGILHQDTSIRFAAPFMRDVLYRNLHAGRKQRLHAEAARVLEAGGAPITDVAEHLLQTLPAGNSRTVEILRKAGNDATERGELEHAVTYLRRALQEPPGDEDLSDLLSELGRAELRYQEPRAIDRLNRAMSLAQEPSLRAQLGLELSAALIGAARHEEAVSLLHTLRFDLDESGLEADIGLARQLNGSLISIAQQTMALRARAAQEVDSLAGEEPATPHLRQMIHTHRAVATLRSGANAAAVVALTKAAVDEGPVAFTDDFSAHAACATAVLFAICGNLADADRLLSETVLYATDRRMLLASDAATGLRAWVRQQCGRAAEAEADARRCLRDAQPGKLLGPALPFAVAALAEVLIARDEPKSAHRFMSELGYLELTPKIPVFALLVVARGRLHLALDRTNDGVLDLLRGRDMLAEWGAPALGAAPAAEAAVALAQMGRLDRARIIAAENLHQARRWGAPREVAMALRAVALTAGGNDAVAPLEEAALLIEQTDACVDRATILYELGAALRRGGARGRARALLNDAVDLAASCGCMGLVGRARQELAATGGRTSAGKGSMPPKLTAGERRVAVLAAEGRRNQEIAHLLFVTVKTVEWHLSQVYRKLGIKSRRQLRAALNWTDGEGSGPRAGDRPREYDPAG